MGKFVYKIVEEVGVLSENKIRGTKKELNIVSWNNRKPKLDIREWSHDHKIVGKGITLTYEEFDKLFSLYLNFEAEIAKITDPVLYLTEFVLENVEPNHQYQIIKQFQELILEYKNERI